VHFRIIHRTRYSYAEPVSRAYNLAHLRPRSFGRQSCARSELLVDPAPSYSAEWMDVFGNRVLHFVLENRHERLTVTATSEVEIAPSTAPPELGHPMPWEEAREYLRAHYSSAEDLDAQHYLRPSPLAPPSPELSAYAEPSFPTGRPMLAAVQDLMERIHTDYVYDLGFTTVATALGDVLAHRRGVCQDFAHLAIGALRSQGLAARYVSGYLETEPPPGQPRLRGADASHAWFSVYVPDQGWVDFDPTNNQVPMDRHITTAWGRDYSDVAPLRGVIFGGGVHHRLEVAVDVERLPVNQPPEPV
jgi:transglutaminase-like putative cysteine protease